MVGWITTRVGAAFAVGATVGMDWPVLAAGVAVALADADAVAERLSSQACTVAVAGPT
jgi:hypothetical protein